MKNRITNTRKIQLGALVLLLVVFFLSAKDTYARYITQNTADTTVGVEQWKIYVNGTDITMESAVPITVTPHYDASSSVVANKIAPGSTGYFDLTVDPSRINLSHEYLLTFTSPMKNLDLKVSHYALAEGSTFTGTPAKTQIQSNTLAGSRTTNVIYTIRCYFVWDDIEGVLNDEADTEIGYNAANGDNQATIVANVWIKQGQELSSR